MAQPRLYWIQLTFNVIIYIGVIPGLTRDPETIKIKMDSGSLQRRAGKAGMTRIINSVMEKIHLLKEIKHSVSSILWYFSIQGAVLILLGVLVLLKPEILVLLFAFFFVFVGLLSIWAALKINRVIKHFNKFFDLFWQPLLLRKFGYLILMLGYYFCLKPTNYKYATNLQIKTVNL